MFDNYVTQKSSYLKIIFLWFNLTSFLLFHIKNTLSCSFKYYKNSDVIAIRKKSLLILSHPQDIRLDLKNSTSIL